MGMRKNVICDDIVIQIEYSVNFFKEGRTTPDVPSSARALHRGVHLRSGQHWRPEGRSRQNCCVPSDRHTRAMFGQRVWLGARHVFGDDFWHRCLAWASDNPTVSTVVIGASCAFLGGVGVGMLVPKDTHNLDVQPFRTAKESMIVLCGLPGMLFATPVLCGAWSGTWVASKINSCRS
jgi:hypothetical protein